MYVYIIITSLSNVNKIYTLMKENISNASVLDRVIELTGVENDNQLAAYLTEQYGITITRQQVAQFRRSDRVTITHLLLREAIKRT